MLPSHKELPRLSAGYALLRGRFLRITQPFATRLREFDLHTLGTPLAFTLNQDQILNKKALMSKHPQMREWTSRHPFFSPCKSCKNQD